MDILLLLALLLIDQLDLLLPLKEVLLLSDSGPAVIIIITAVVVDFICLNGRLPCVVCFPLSRQQLQLTINCFSSSSSSFDTVCPLWCPLSLSLSLILRLGVSSPPPTLHTESDLSCELQTSSSSDFCSKCRPFSFTFTHSFHYYTPCYTCTNTCPFLSLAGSISGGRHGVRQFSLVSLHHVCVRTVVVVVGGGGGGNAETIEES